jgi:hypothetical protein
MKILDRIVDDDGIRMDPDKVDSVANWKTLTNRDLLRGFIGLAGYLADDIYKVRVPMGVLSAITGDNVPFKWTNTEQRAFECVKQYVQACHDHRRVPLVYSKTAPHVWLMTDMCINGIATVIVQGNDWKTANITAFFSAKLSTAELPGPRARNAHGGRGYAAVSQHMLRFIYTLFLSLDSLLPSRRLTLYSSF